MIDINKLTTKKGNINSGILAVADKQDRFVVTDIDIEDLIPSEDNFYSLTDIESLKENIEEFGLQQNLTVMRRPDKKYEIISGHRRHEACRLLVKEGKKKFSWLPCRIIPTMSDTVKNILLITMNSETRKKTSAEITEEIERLKILYTDYKKENPEFKGRIRETIAENMGMSVANVGRHEKISKNLIPEVKEAYKGNDINFAAANELSGLSAEDQKAVYEETGGKVTVKDVKQYQQEIKQPQEPENLNIDGFDVVPKSEKDFVQQTGNEIDEDLENYTEGPCNECGMYRDEYIEESVLVIPQKYKMTLKIEIAHDPRDGKYRTGINMSKSDRGFSCGPGDTDEAYDTKKEAFAAAIMDMAESDDDVEQALIAGGYIKTDTEKGESRLPVAGIEHRIYAVQSTMELFQKQIEKAAALKQIDEREGNTEGAANRVAQIEYLGKMLERTQKDLFDLSGQNVFKEEAK